MITRVLFLTANIPFASSIRTALQGTGLFEVRLFSLPDAAIEYLRENPIEAAIVDFTLPGTRIDQVVEGLRMASPQLAIIATPRQLEEVVRLLRLQNSVNTPFSARYIIPVLDKAVADVRENPLPLPSTRPNLRPNLPSMYAMDENTPVVPFAAPYAPQEPAGTVDPAFQEILSSIDPPSKDSEPKKPRSQFDTLVNSMRTEQSRGSLPARQQEFVDFILRGGMNPLLDQIQQSRKDESETPPQPSGRFDELAAEEPPVPSIEEGGTVTDLINSASDVGFRNVLALMRGEEEIVEEPPPPITFDDVPSFWSPDADEIPPEFVSNVSPPSSLPEYDFSAVPPMPDTLPETPAAPAEFSPATYILQESGDPTHWTGKFSLEDLIASIERYQSAQKPQIKPLPSWIKESQVQRKKTKPPKKAKSDRSISESQPSSAEPPPMPETLPESPVPAQSDPISLSQQYADQPTVLSAAQRLESAPQDLETSWDTPQPRSSGASEPPQPDTLPELPPPVVLSSSPFVLDENDEWTQYPPPVVPPSDEFDDELPEEFAGEAFPDHAPIIVEDDLPRFTVDDFNTEFERLSAFEMAARQAASADDANVQEAYLAQLALSLTQVSLELTAEATLLTLQNDDGGRLIAYAGRMASEDVDELRNMIADDWDVNAEEARIRFVTLPSTGKDYLLYSRKTIDDLILSLVFGGSTPLKDIRRQGRRLVEALKTVPERGQADMIAVASTVLPPAQSLTSPAISVLDAPEAANYVAYACVWLLRDPNMRLDEAVSRAIISGLNAQLRERFWRIQTLQVQGDYVYLLAEIPGDNAPYQVIRDLKRRSAEIATKTSSDLSENLWADSYLIVAPGRPLEDDEIHQFLNFERMV